LNGHIHARKAGHALHIEFARALAVASRRRAADAGEPMGRARRRATARS
jgi:hypothetical protein